MICTLCDVAEAKQDGTAVHPYRCSRCGECRLCKHTLIGYEWWVCPDGARRPTTFDPGVPVKDAFAKKAV